MDPLKEYRDKIDAIDQEILDAFLKRLSIVQKIVEVKKERGLPIFDEKREREVIKKRMNLLPSSENFELVEKLFYTIMDLSKAYQWEEIENVSTEDLKIGYLGEKGSFSFIAAKKCFETSELKSYDRFEDIFKAVESGKVEKAVLPIENTSTGSIIEVYDLLKKYHMQIVGEKNVEINHFLLAKPGVTIDAIEKVYSHPQALSQSKDFLKNYDWQLINSENTSGSALMVHESEERNIAAIASLEAAKLYDLEVLKDNINYNEKNITRFIIISKRKEHIEKADKITLGFSVAHEPGALYDVLGIFQKNKINLYKLESRPIIQSPFEYYFYADLAGNIEEEVIQKVLEQVKENSLSMKIYGNYKRDHRRF